MKQKKYILALDAMGGDNAPSIVFEGAELFLSKNKNVSCVFYGPSDILEMHRSQLLSRSPSLKSQISLKDASDIITNNTKVVSAVRLKNSSLRLALTDLREGKVDAVVSAGNTGAYMALSKLILGMIPCIDRPAIPAIIPTLKSHSLVLDLGANIECTAENLVQFAYMGEALARQVLGCEKPIVGILNIGSEEEKGGSTLQEAAQILRCDPELSFFGFVEGNDITAGTTDVIVTDGFSGNIALKTLEGATKLMTTMLKESLNQSFLGKLGAIIARGSLSALKSRLDPRLYNGAAFLGVKGIAVKSHGGTDAIGFENAINVTYKMVKNNLIHEIEQKVSRRLVLEKQAV